MGTKLTRRDWLWVAGFFGLFFVIIPLCLWQWSDYRKYGSEHEARRIASAAIESSMPAIQAAADALDREVTSTDMGIKRNTPANQALKNACADIQRSIQQRSKNYSNRDWNCSFNIRKLGVYFKEDISILRTADKYELERIENEIEKMDPLYIFSQGTGSFSVYYRLKSDPLIIFGFSVETNTPDYH